MNITFIVPTLDKGGSERVISLLSDRFVKSSYTTSIVTLYNSKSPYSVSPSVKILSLNLTKLSEAKSFVSKIYYFFKRISSIANYFKNKDDIIIVLSSDVLNATVVISKLLYNLNNKIILSCRSNPLLARRAIERKCIYFFYKFGDRVVVQSNYIKNYLSKTINSKKLVLINNPSTIYYDDNPYILNENKDIDFLSVGRIHHAKNHIDIVKALDILSKKIGYNTSLYIVGRDDGAKKKIDQFLSEKKMLKRNIVFTGERRDLEKIYLNSKILIHYSKYEGQSNVIIESQSYGIPAIVSNYPAADEVILNNHNGFIVESNDPIELASKMEILIKNNKLQERLSKRSFEYSRKFHISKIFIQWENLILSVI